MTRSMSNTVYTINVYDIDMDNTSDMDMKQCIC